MGKTRRPETAAYQHWYWSPWWKKARAEHLRQEPYCRMCARAGRQTPAKVVDHIVAHRGSWALFTDVSNLQSLCSIHDGEKQRVESGGKPRQIIGADGWPVDATRG